MLATKNITAQDNRIVLAISDDDLWGHVPRGNFFKLILI